ncbi:MAG TPA: hypothetical protein VNS49_05915 [Streptomyces sp.]|nr:hypothetical protein [Streptomyces sp.]
MDRTRSVKKRLGQALHALCATAVTASTAADSPATAADANALAPKNGCRALRGHG